MQSFCCHLYSCHLTFEFAYARRLVLLAVSNLNQVQDLLFPQEHCQFKLDKILHEVSLQFDEYCCFCCCLWGLLSYSIAPIVQALAFDVSICYKNEMLWGKEYPLFILLTLCFHLPFIVSPKNLLFLIVSLWYIYDYFSFLLAKFYSCSQYGDWHK